jgi:response regulator RpfG family c-di-GMP phosphodiesterase
MTGTILFVDDEPNVLASLQRTFLDADLTVLTASDGLGAIDILKQQPVSVITSDNMMPGMTGIELLRQAKEVAPDTVRILLTAFADASAAISAINSGEVYKFITKPWDNNDLKRVMHEAVERHQTVASLKRADEAMLRSLAQTIELKDPYTRGHCDRVAGFAVRLAETLSLPEETRRNIKHGSWLHDCGKIGVPGAVLNFNGPLSPEQMAIVKNHSQWGADVAKLAHLPETVINVIMYHHEHFDGTGYPTGLKGRDIPLEARIVTVADTFDAMTSDRPYRKGLSLEAALERIEGLKGSLFDPQITDLFLKLMNFQKETS